MQSAEELAAFGNVVGIPVIEHHIDLFFDEFKIDRGIELLLHIENVLV
jgi:hypothetical protein